MSTADKTDKQCSVRQLKTVQAACQAASPQARYVFLYQSNAGHLFVSKKMQSPEPHSVAPAREWRVSKRGLGAAGGKPFSLQYCGEKDCILGWVVEEATVTAGEETFAEKLLVKAIPEGCYYLRIVLILISVLFLVLSNLNQRKKTLLFFSFCCGFCFGLRLLAFLWQCNPVLSWLIDE